MPERAADPNQKLVEEAMKAIEETGLPLVVDAKSADPLFVSARDLPLRFIIPVAKVKPFFDALKDGRLTAAKCVKCGAKYFPPQVDCPSCKGSEVEFVPLSGTADLLAYTLINVKPYSFAQYGDYVVAIGRFPAGINVLAWMKGVQAEKVKVGMKLLLRVGKREADGVCSYWFEPA
jgi:uncharacterized OB-fold protein